MRDSSRLTRRAALGLTAAALPLSAAGPAHATAVIGGDRLARGGIQARGATGLPKKLTARSWIVADGGSGEVLAAFNAHRRLPPASTLKMLFADTVLKKFERTERYKVTDADLAGIPSGSSLVGVKPGITYTVEQLWQGVFLHSGNDAVHVLALMNGGVAKTVAEMQAEAEDLQALDTHVVSPDGFDHPEQLSSAYDLTLFARHGLKNEDFRGYCGTRTADFPAGGKKTFQIQNTDRLLTGAWGRGAYKGLIGVKNGYTSHAGNTFTGAATRGGRTLLVTVMHPAGSNAVYEETAALLDWGFGAGSSAQAVGTLVEPLSEGGAKAKSARAAAGAPGSASGRPSTWRLLEGGAGTVALLGGGVWALRRRWAGKNAGNAAGRAAKRATGKHARETGLDETDVERAGRG
ncbi:D-alanyl-D-alanine carboxypeptidase family protein [Streptomyces sp. HUAS TT20]|uniref:D-alanyl-D-alanine carboxypeptidase family protein n=1 Tax=Streptomyces sp. HUAS TT20 TaxID=3447509 RepID=UPI0021D9F080|nr:serine hydrolase [Streptomyces sp. HUAS 15-9]UXY27226.1 serine hydrolase [Streptomyces sp. HUAS 15-9]